MTTHSQPAVSPDALRQGQRRARPPRIAFAGDRDVAVQVLDYLKDQNAAPLALMVSKPELATHAEALRERCAGLDEDRVLVGDAFRSPRGIALLRELELDLVIGVHFPYLVPPEVLAIPREGVLNLHPAFLPWNRGWHTPSWAILDGTPIGATLHFMDAGVDSGDIVHQRPLAVLPGDTADSLYRRLRELELEVFRDAWPAIAAGTYERHPQDPESGSAHKRRELFADDVQRIDLDAPTTARELLRRLRALTTNTPAEAAWFEADGERWRVQVRFERAAAMERESQKDVTQPAPAPPKDQAVTRAGAGDTSHTDSSGSAS